MMRLVRTFRPLGQTLPFLLLNRGAQHLGTAQKLVSATYYPLIFAALLLLPGLATGQCYNLVCNQNVPLKLTADCTGSVNPYYIITNNWSCQGPMTMQYYTQWGVPVGTIVDGSYLGQTLDVHVTHNWTGLTCWGTVQVVDQTKPTIVIPNVTLNCSEDPSPASVGEPTVADNCSSNITVSHQDSVIDFGCGYTGFAGYFDPSNWEICLPTTGGGGVDVTGAPGQVLVEGADTAPVASNPPKVTRFKIVIPTEGFVSFNWSSTGGSNFDNEGFYLTINNWCVQITNNAVQSGSYTTGLLQPGDVLSFEQMSDGDFNAVNTLVSNFHFHTLAWKVIHRVWAATDEGGNTRYKTQVVTLNRATLSQVQFPPNRDGIAAPMLNCGAAADLAITGLPFIDEDDNLGTTDDQFDLQSGDCMLSYLFEDQTIATCEGSELVLRKWTVVDDCTSQILEHTQIIKLFDTTAPTIVCPPAQVLSTDDFGCFGVLNLPQANATDACSSTINISPTWNFGTGFGPYNNVAIGTYTVTYLATDACGNVGACATTVTVQDAVSPTVVCDGQTVASLDSDGQAMVYADAVDDGSYDWCCIANYEIKLENAPDATYGPTLPVSCGDIGLPLMVRLRVTDCAGNWNTCDVEIIVQDQYDPVILAPANLTVDCSTDLSDLSQFGEAIAVDNCQLDLVETATESATGCGQASIVRTWTATDPSGNVASASQTITLSNLSPWNQSGNAIAWPPNYLTNQCGASLEPWELPMPYSGPLLGGQNGCESVAVTHDDEVFWLAEPACYKIFRTWTIIDWCQWQPNSGSNTGIWEHVQVLEVVDTEAPVFIDPPVQIFAAGNSNCSSDVLLPMPQVADCSDHIFITATGQLGAGFSFANVAGGTYQMTYTAHDGCGNSTTHTFNVSVGDDQPPTAYCINGLTVALGTAGEIAVNASTFDAGSSDACSDNLLFCYSPNPNDEVQMFNCDDMGQNPVQLYVIDEGGNMATCQTFLMVMDNSGACNPPQPDLTVAGLLQTPEGEPVANAQMTLAGAQVPPFVTSSSGSFSFGNLPAGNDYLLTPSKNTGFLNGVTAFDIYKVNNHIIGVEPFTTPWQLIAADVNGSNSVTTADLLAIQQLILQYVPQFPNGVPSWVFVPSDHTFADWQQPWGYPTSMAMPGLADDYPDAHFTAVKKGDVTGSANPLFAVLSSQFGSSALGSPAVLSPAVLNPEVGGRGAETLRIEVADRLFAEGETVEVKLSAAEAAAWQATLEFDAETIEFQEVIENTGEGHLLAFGKTQVAEGTLTAAFSGAAAVDFTLRFLAKKPGLLSQSLHLSDARTPTAAWGFAGEEMEVGLSFLPPDHLSANHHVSPNPFASQTTLYFHLPEAGAVKIRFVDPAGRLLHEVAGHFAEGENQVVVKQDDLGVTGLVLYRVESGEGSAAGRLMVVD